MPGIKNSIAGAGKSARFSGKQSPEIPSRALYTTTIAVFANQCGLSGILVTVTTLYYIIHYNKVIIRYELKWLTATVHTISHVLMMCVSMLALVYCFTCITAHTCTDTQMLEICCRIVFRIQSFWIQSHACQLFETRQSSLFLLKRNLLVCYQ